MGVMLRRVSTYLHEWNGLVLHRPSHVMVGVVGNLKDVVEVPCALMNPFAGDVK